MWLGRFSGTSLKMRCLQATEPRGVWKWTGCWSNATMNWGHQLPREWVCWSSQILEKAPLSSLFWSIAKQGKWDIWFLRSRGPLPSNKNGWTATKSLLACRWLDSPLILLPLPVEVMWKTPRWKVCTAQAEDGNRFGWDAAASWPQALQVPRWFGKEIWIPGPHTPAALWHDGKTGSWKGDIEVQPGTEASPDCSPSEVFEKLSPSLFLDLWIWKLHGPHGESGKGMCERPVSQQICREHCAKV